MLQALRTQQDLNGALDMSRIRVMPRGDMLLVMDRLSGRWLYLPRDQLGLLQILGAGGVAQAPQPLRGQLDAMQASLVSHRIGMTGAESDFSQFNTVILKLTNACNLACAYCYDYESSERARRIAGPVARRALEQAISLCDEQLWVILHGGEPMLVWSLIEEIVRSGEDLAHRRGVKIDFTGQTNMTRLTEEIVAFSTEHDIAWGVSLDGLPALNDRHRRSHDGGGSFDLFLSMLEKYPGFVRRSSVMSTITAANQSRLLESARYFRDLGMAGWDWSLFQPTGRGRGKTDFDIDATALVEAWHELFDAVLAGEFDGFPVQPVKKYVMNFFYGPGKNMCMRPKCGAARDLLSVSVDGTVEACDCIDPTGPMANLGNVSDDGLAGAHASPVADYIRSRDLGRSACSDCIWFGVCGGTCVAHAGDVDRVHLEGCAIALTAFDRISKEMAQGDRLNRYMRSLP